MANMHDYLRWRGDLSFAERPFNDVDNLVLSALSYLDFTGIVPTEQEGGSIGLREACARLRSQAGGDVTPYVRSLARIDTEFVRLVGKSARFGAATLSAYADVVDEQRELQFAAVQVDLPHGGTYVAFRGTDTSLVGWRENLKLSYSISEAQREAVRYLERTVARAADPRATIRVGGHSKGGNLAEYATAFCAREARDRITMVYSNDAPNTSPEVLAEDTRAMLDGRLRRIVPSYSVIGMLFARKNDVHAVVESSAQRIEQHDITTWQVCRDGIEQAQGLSPDCRTICDALAAWVRSIPLDERRRVSDEVFDALESDGATTLEQVADSPERLQRTLRALGETDERTRSLAFALVQHMLDGSVDAAVASARKAFEDAGQRLRSGRRSRKGVPVPLPDQR